MAEMVEVGKQKVQIAREMLDLEKSKRSTIPPIDICMQRVYSLVGPSNISAMAAGMSLRAESDRQLFMTLNDDLAIVWINHQVVVNNLNYRPDFPPM